jgi:hypothetical protein
MVIFSKFFVDVMTHIVRDNAAKRIKCMGQGISFKSETNNP